jgi:hypothetical protein
MRSQGQTGDLLLSGDGGALTYTTLSVHRRSEQQHEKLEWACRVRNASRSVLSYDDNRAEALRKIAGHQSVRFAIVANPQPRNLSLCLPGYGGEVTLVIF